jgi:hypothetical protein
MKLYPGHLAEVTDIKALEGNIHHLGITVHDIEER